QLAALYASGLPQAQMRAQRDALREALRQRYQQARAANPDLDGYRDWFAGPLNNAQLNTLNDYEGWVPGFDAIVSRCQGDWPCFWKEVERIAKLPAEKRKALLETPDA
ncbi:MAG: aminopeptidase, partial [Alcanivorax sp.]|nr:aminopeptidase [Alcanivorax sp.]